MKNFDLKHTSSVLLASAILLLSGAVSATSAPQVSVSAATVASSTSVAQTETSSMDKAGKQFKSGHHSRHGKFRQGKHHHKMKDVALWIPGYGPVSKDVAASLSLTEKQTALLQDAQQSMKSQNKHVRPDWRKQGDVIKQHGLDPHAAVQKQSQRFAEKQQARTNSTQKWLTLWDSLEPAQQEKLSAHIAERMDKRAQHAQKRMERRGKNTA